ncbi:MAG: hypothetical protein H6873_02980 [Hyphomicrobiaceae bacterium]|nr:hypothetical protein [Hyphomicrobiaceae bacterium]
MLWGALIAVLLAAVAAIAQIYRDPAYTPEIRRRTFRVLGYFTLYLAAGIAGLIALPLERLTGPGLVFLVLAIFAWVGLGSVWILRTTPSKRPPPQWLLKPWTWVDWLVIGTIIVGAGGTLWSIFANAPAV